MEFGQSTYIVGPNNSGKTALLSALHCFFDSTHFSPDFLNKTELAAKKEGFNRSDVGVEFDLTQIPGGTRQKRMRENYGDRLFLMKSFTWREASRTVQIEFTIKSKKLTLEQLDKDIREMLEAVSISYIHPQEGTALLQKAQEKFKQRLFHNWGRHASVAERVKELQEKWTALRTTANSYLSSTLTSRLREIWPAAEVHIELPERIQDIVAVSDISFRSSPTLPQVTLPAHGTGAQSAILYQTHYLLDSDRTLHPGPYFPTWLLEEPESFLHADIALQLARLLSSDEWLSNIQMIISTHSAITLAASRSNSDKCKWVVCDSHTVRWQKLVAHVTEDDISDIAKTMGDANFGVYFDSSEREAKVFFEDSRDVTLEKFARLGVPVKTGISGVTDVRRHIHALRTLGGTVGGDIYFVVDADRGLNDLKKELDGAEQVAARNGWVKLRVSRGVYVVKAPSGLACEDLFAEWPEHLGEICDEIYDEKLVMRKQISTDLSRAVATLRGKVIKTRTEATEALRAQQDVKDRFWAAAADYSFEQSHRDAINALLPQAQQN